MTWGNAISLIGSLGALITVLFGVWKYYQDRNRSLYERRLNEVYAPLFGRLVKQETFRYLFMPERRFEEYPILAAFTQPTETKLHFGEREVQLKPEPTGDKTTIFDRQDFLERLNQTTKGLARPTLLTLISQYEILVHVIEEKMIDESNQRWDVFWDHVMQVEKDLVDEIVDGYEESISKLGLDSNDYINNPTRLFQHDR